jgi:DNA-binding beta-propeller fold protein YncE
MWRERRSRTSASGLVVTRVHGERLFVTVNDSGDSGRVFTIDPTTGETVGTTSFTPEPRDVEAVAPAGDGHVWVADIGDNLVARDHVRITRVPVGRGTLDAGAAESYRLTYPDRAKDAEALVTHPDTGRVYVISKQVFGGTVHAAPERLDAGGDNVLEEIGSAPMLVTDAAFSPDGRYVVMRGYGDAWVKSFPDLDTVAGFALPRQPQGEGLAVGADGSVYLSTEGRERPVLRAPLPIGLKAELAGGSFWWRKVWQGYEPPA